MNVNVSQYKVRFLESGSIELILSTPEMEKEKYYNKTSVIITKNELPLFLECLKGESKVYPYFSDISYLIRPSIDGFTYVHLNGSTYTQIYFYFPNKLLGDLHTMLSEHIESPLPEHSQYCLSDIDLQDYANKVKPKFTWNYHHDTTGRWYTNESGFSQYLEDVRTNILDSLTKYSEKYPSLKNALESLERIASNYSTFGEDISIDIFFDGLPKPDQIPDSYYFSITHPIGDKNGNHKIMNGGIIFHPKYNQDDLFVGEYSIHT